MAVYERSGFLKYKDENGDTNLLLPITSKDNVDGLDDIEAALETTVRYTTQTLTDAQQEQVRKNIGVNHTGIASIEQTSTSEADSGNNVITVTMTDGAKKTFTIQNGSQGPTGKTAYEYAREGGYAGSEATFSAKLAEEAPKAFYVTVSEDAASADKTNAEIYEAYTNGHPVYCVCMACEGMIMSPAMIMETTAVFCAVLGETIVGVIIAEDSVSMETASILTEAALPNMLPNPKAIMFSGAVDATYDGSQLLHVNIPTVEFSKEGHLATIVVKDAAGEHTLELTDAQDATEKATQLMEYHNTDEKAHYNLRNLISELTTRLNTLADSDDTTLDQMSELVAYIKSNKGLIDSITTSKVNVADIVNNLTSNVSNKPLSAAQGVALKAQLDGKETAGAAANALSQAKSYADAAIATALNGELTLVDRTTKKNYTLYVDNGKLVMEEAT